MLLVLWLAMAYCAVKQCPFLAVCRGSVLSARSALDLAGAAPYDDGISVGASVAALGYMIKPRGVMQYD